MKIKIWAYIIILNFNKNYIKDRTIIFANDLALIYHKDLNTKVMGTIEFIEHEFQMIINHI